MLSIPDHVHFARCDGGTAVLDLDQGQWHLFTGLGEHVWNRAAMYGSTTGLPEQIAIPASGDIAALRSAVDTFVAQLVDMGLLADTARPAVRRRFWRRNSR
ncbi:hypothetical protein [Streptomyces griseus]|uniref:hypothetical protein n=1 Tax=Streptomyces griseus TaxID=1911 RepID=UPI00378AB3D0